MADHETHSRPADAAAQRPTEHAHPGAKEYLAIAVVLTVITAVEVAVFYVPAMHPILAPTLLLLSAVKFGMVAMWYMHLKFDHRLFSWLFVVPMVVMATIIIALLRLFGHW